jgi:hypothetical protein
VRVEKYYVCRVSGLARGINDVKHSICNGDNNVLTFSETMHSWKIYERNMKTEKIASIEVISNGLVKKGPIRACQCIITVPYGVQDASTSQNSITTNLFLLIY